MKKKRVKRLKRMEKGYGKRCLSYLASTYQGLFKSFKDLDKKFFLVSLCEALFIASGILVFVLGSNLLGRVRSRLIPITSQPLQITGAQMEALPTAIVMLLTWAVLTFLAVVIAQSVFKGIIWTTIVGKKFTSKYFKSFFWLNILWFLIWLATSLIIYFGVSARFKTYVQGAYLLLLFHFTTILYILFTKRNVIGKNIKKAFALGVRKARYFAVPYIYSVIVYVLLSQIARIFRPESKTGLFVTVVITIFFIAWMRLYIYSVVEEVLV